MELHIDSLKKTALIAAFSIALVAPAQQQIQFEPAVDYTVPPFPRAVASADFNNDGNVDVCCITAAGKICIFMGDGTGNLSKEQELDVIMNGTAIATTDLNNDGNYDIVSTQGVFLGTATGSFTPVSIFFPPGQIGVAHFNSDAFMDVAVLSPNNYGVAVYAGDGNGSFAAPQTYTFNGYPRRFAIADFDKDGKQDMAISLDNHQLVVLYGNVLGFDSPVYIPGANNVWDINAVDLNKDGHIDLVASGSVVQKYYVFLNDGLGNFTPKKSFNTLYVTYFLTTADFDKDGNPDIVGNTLSNQIWIAKGTGGSDPLPTTFAVSEYGFDKIIATDLNNDGYPDLVGNVISQSADQIRVMLNRTGQNTGFAEPNVITTFQVVPRKNGCMVKGFKETKISISDISGRLIHSGELNHFNNYSLEYNGLPDGFYICRAVNPSAVVKFVVND